MLEDKSNNRLYLEDGDELVNGEGKTITYRVGQPLGLEPFLKDDTDFRFKRDGVLLDVYYDVDEDSSRRHQLFTRPEFVRKKGLVK